MELHVGEIVELVIKLPIAPAATRAIVRGRNVFRHGFEFVQPLHEIVGNGTVAGRLPDLRRDRLPPPFG